MNNLLGRVTVPKALSFGTSQDAAPNGKMIYDIYCDRRDCRLQKELWTVVSLPNTFATPAYCDASNPSPISFKKVLGTEETLLR